MIAFRRKRPISALARRRRAAVILLVLALPAVGPAFAQEATPAGILTALSTQEPRAFGYTVGDTATRTVEVTVADPLRLAEDSLPKIGRLGYALDLRQVNVASRASGTGTRYTLQLTYQIFLAPREVRTLDLPAFMLRFEGGRLPEEVRIDYWPVTVAPLAPAEASRRAGLGLLRPDIEPPLMETRRGEWRLLAYATVAALLLFYLAYVYFGLPFLSRRGRPFAYAYREVRKLADRNPAMSPEAFRTASRRIHGAFNQTAGNVLFAENLDGFIATRPDFAPLRGEIARFFERSRAEFFAGGKNAAEDLRWLVGFCRDCRDAERMAAA